MSPFQVQGVVFGRQLHALPFVRTTNSTTITVYRRPTNAFKADEDYPYIKRTELSFLSFISTFRFLLVVLYNLHSSLISCSPRKDRLFIYLAPVFHWKTQPTSVFNHALPYEKLRICLNYTAQSSREGRKFIRWKFFRLLLQEVSLFGIILL